MLTSILLCLSCVVPLPPARAGIHHVDATHGVDAPERGTREHPWKTITFALASAAGGATIEIHEGRYDATGGERFPIALRPGITLRAGGAQHAVIAADANAVALFAAEQPGDFALNGLHLEGGRTGVRLAAGVTMRVELRAMTFTACQRGVFLPAHDREHGARGAATIAIEASRFEQAEFGVLLGGESSVEVASVASVRAERSEFYRCTRSGLELHALPLEASDQPTFCVSECSFADNDIGLHVPRPSADARLDVSRCRFERNTTFGVRLCGGSASSAQHNKITGNSFEANGVALHLNNCLLPLDISRNRICTSVGNGIFYANFLSDQTTQTIIDSNIIARNGADGICMLSDGHNMRATVIHNTIVGNGQIGIRRRDKHGGKSNFLIANCIVWDNRQSLERIAPEEVTHCLVADGDFGGKNGNLTGDPLFVDAQHFDFRLRPGSPCRDAGHHDQGTGPSPDFAGNVRKVPVDIGALEGDTP